MRSDSMEPETTTTSEISLDWDISYETFKDSVSFDILTKWLNVNIMLVSRVYSRQSSNGNTHIKIEFTKPIPFLQKPLPIQICFALLIS